MPDIILPKRGASQPGRRPSANTPGADTLPAPNPAVGQELARQEHLKDAVEAAKIRDSVASRLREDLDARTVGMDFADEAVRGDFSNLVEREIGNAKQRFRSVDGAARLSDAAGARLDADLDGIGRVFQERAATLHLTALEQRGIDQLNAVTGNTAERTRLGVAAVPAGDTPMFLTAELDLFDETVDEFTGALTGNKDRDIRVTGKAAIIEAAAFGLAGAGRGDEALALLDNEDMGGLLDAASRARLKRGTADLADAQAWDRQQQEAGAAAEEIRARDAASLAFTTGFRPRLASGAATLAEIAEAETGGVLTPPQAARLRTEYEDARDRRAQNAMLAERVTAALRAGSRLDPADADDRGAVARHYEAALRPALPDMDPADKAAAIGAYGARTGYIPDRALNTLLGLAVTGEAAGRIGAVNHLLQLFDADPTARDRVPPPLATVAGLMAELSRTEEIPPDQIITIADELLLGMITGEVPGMALPTPLPDNGTGIPLPDAAPGKGTGIPLPNAALGKGTGMPMPNPGLILLASAQSGGGGPAASPTDAPPAPVGEGDSAPVVDPASGEADVLEDENEDTLFPDDDEGSGEVPGTGTEPEFPPDQLARLAEIAGRLSRPGSAPGLSAAEAADRNIAALDDMKRTASAEEEEFGTLVLSLVPGLGSVIDGNDAVAAFREAERLEADGKLDEALDKRGEGSLAAFGALPLIGAIAKTPKVGRKFKRLFDRLSPGRRAAQEARTVVEKEGFDPAIKNWTRLKPEKPRTFNNDFAQRHRKVNPDSTPHPPYDEKFPVVRGRYRPGHPPLVRVYADPEFKAGGWLMTRADYEEALKRPDPAGFLKEKFALKDPPKFVSDFVYDQPVDMKVGIAAKHPKLGEGGGRQFELGDWAKKSWFSESRDIPGGK